MLHQSRDERRDHERLMAGIEAMEYEPSCTNYPDAYFPEVGQPYTSWETKWAISMCKECPIVNLCAEYGLKWERYGIWGGLTPMERAKWRRARGRSLEGDRPTDDTGKRVPIQRLDGKYVRKTA